MTNPYFNAYVKALIKLDNDCYYLSPQLLDSLNNKLCDPVHNTYKSDIWALGMTILEIATLKPS